MEAHVDPVVLILDTLPMDLNEINELFMLNREQLAGRIQEIIPDDQGDKIARFLKALSICGWRFADIDEQALQKISENDAVVTEKLLRLQGRNPRSRKIALSRLYPRLAKEGRIRNVSSYRHLRSAEASTQAMKSSTSPTDPDSHSLHNHKPPHDPAATPKPSAGGSAEPPNTPKTSQAESRVTYLFPTFNRARTAPAA